MTDREKLIEQAEDILNKWEFFYGQRAGRELWEEKPEEIQNADIEAFCRDLTVIRSAVTDNNVGSKWIPASEPPKKWKDENGDAINYLIYSPGIGVDIGYWIQTVKAWFCLGVPFKVTHWMLLPEPPKEDAK